MDMTRAREWIGFEAATSLREGLQKTWAWFMANQTEYLHRKNYWTEA
jgi:nucleoside-diphosphate-sugar epimerase